MPWNDKVAKERMRGKMAGFWRKYVSLMALVLLWGAGNVWAEKTTGTSASSAASPPTASSPAPDHTERGGVADIIPRASALKEIAAREREQVEMLGIISSFEEQIREAIQEQDAIDRQKVEIDKSGRKDIDKLSLFQETVSQHNKALK